MTRVSCGTADSGWSFICKICGKTLNKKDVTSKGYPRNIVVKYSTKILLRSAISSITGWRKLLKIFVSLRLKIRNESQSATAQSSTYSPLNSRIARNLLHAWILCDFTTWWQHYGRADQRTPMSLRSHLITTHSSINILFYNTRTISAVFHACLAENYFFTPWQK